jgi:hypothetical protein
MTRRMTRALFSIRPETMALIDEAWPTSAHRNRSSFVDEILEREVSAYLQERKPRIDRMIEAARNNG